MCVIVVLLECLDVPLDSVPVYTDVKGLSRISMVILEIRIK